MDDLRPRGPGRFVLRALAIASALGFLALVMVQAMAFYAPPADAPKKSLQHLLGPATKAAPVFHPPPPAKPEQPEERRYLLPATKAGILGPLKLSRPAPAPQPQATPLPPD